jgi:hypothetical protein
MMEYNNSRPARIIGPGNEVLTRENMPPPNTNRWVASRKAQVVAAVESGLMPIEEVMARYSLSLEEFCSWQRAMSSAGVEGLRVGWAQHERYLRRREPERTGPRLAVR